MFCPVAAAQTDPYAFSVVLAYGPFYPPSVWVPIRSEFINRTDQAIDGSARFPIAGDLTPVQIALPARVPSQSRVVATGYVFLPPIEIKEGDPMPTLAMGTWYSSGGARLNRCPLLGRPIRAADGSSTLDVSGPFAGRLLLQISGPDYTGDLDSYDAFDFAKSISTLFSATFQPAPLQQNTTPRRTVGYLPAGLVCVDAAALESLDPLQRKVLMEYVSGGGLLVLSAPPPSIDLCASWLAPYLPVHVVGHREATELHATDHRGQRISLKLREPIELCEATPADGGHVMLRDDHYVYIAERPHGYGRIIFTGFPINALDLADEVVQQIWSELLSNPNPASDWRHTVLAEQRGQVLESMVGQPTVPWRQAAMLAGAYFAVVLLAQLFVGAGRRPGAFGALVAVALLLSAVLVMFTHVQRREQRLLGARLATLEAAPGGGGTHRELLTFLGKDDPRFSLRAARSDVALRPAVAAAPPLVQMYPFAAPDAGVHEAKVEHTWHAEATVANGKRIDASAQFTSDGLRLTVHNALGGTLAAPLLIWDRSRFSLTDLPEGPGNLLVTMPSRNLADDFTNVAVFTSQEAKLRGEILKKSLTPSQAALLSPRAATQILLAGWLDDTSAPPLVNTSADQMDLRSQVLLRTPVRIEPSTPGSTVRIDGPFTRIVQQESRGLPYDVNLGEWLRTNMDGQWLLSVAAPEQIGRLRPVRAVIEVDVTAPQQTITLRKGQCAGGKVAETLAPEPFVTFQHTIARQSVSVDLGPSDVDAHGRFWILLHVAGAPPGSVDLPQSWHLRQFETTLEAEVIKNAE